MTFFGERRLLVRAALHERTFTWLLKRDEEFPQVQSIHNIQKIKELNSESFCELRPSAAFKIFNQGTVWNGNFGMEYGRCQNGMEDNLPYRTRFCALYLP